MEFENTYLNEENISSCKHEAKNLFPIKQNYLVCFGCSSLIYTNESGKKIFPVKPEKYNTPQETATPIFISLKDNHCPYRFYNKEELIKIRMKIVKKMKAFVQHFNLTKKTYFVALDYFDRICTKIYLFNFDDLMLIAHICVVLAAKFQDDHQNAMAAKLSLSLSNNYSKDELYILRLLNYDLYSFTPYDIVMDIMHTGFLFNNEKFSRRKMNIVYSKIEKILYFFSEIKYYIDMTPMEIALSVIGFIRETLGLVAYNDIIKNIFMPNDDVKKYLICLNKFKRCFKIEDNIRNNNNNNENINEKDNNNQVNETSSEQSTDSRSGSFDSNSENSDESRKNSLIKESEN